MVKMSSRVEGIRMRQTQACMNSLTLQSSQHCPWAQTASPLRVHVVALQHGFIHSLNEGKKTKQLTCGPNHHPGVLMSAGPCQIKTSRSRELSSCPGIPALCTLTCRPLSGDILNEAHMFWIWEFSGPLDLCKEELV